MLTALHNLIARLDGEAVQVEKELAAEAKAELAVLLENAAKVVPLITTVQAELGPHLASLPPEVRTVVDGLLSKLAADAEKLLESHPAA